MHKALTLMCAALVLAASSSCSQREPGPGTTTTITSASTATTSAPAPSSTPTLPALSSSSSTTTTGCAETRPWTSDDRRVDWGAFGAPLYLFDAGRHPCFDRLVLQLNGPEPAGVAIAYTSGEVGYPGSGDPITTAGDVALDIHVLAPVLGGFYDQTGHQPGAQPFGPIGSSIYPTSNPKGLRAVREVRFGGDFEAETTFAVGVDRRRPFTVSTFIDENQIRRLVIDIAS